LERAGSPTELEAEARRLVQAGKLPAAAVTVLNFEGLARFWNSPVGRCIREQAGSVRRELGFTARFSPGEFRRVIGAAPAPGLEDESVVVQGVADLVVLLPDELWLLDFKTDSISKPELESRVRTYEPQLRLYALALERIYRRPVKQLWVHFLALDETVRLDDFNS
jgi:ATP-dependent helicase/nuclease subunit A